MDNKYYTQEVDDKVKTIPQQEIMNHYTTFHKKKSTNARYKDKILEKEIEEIKAKLA